jgi:DUF1680 family protein
VEIPVGNERLRISGNYPWQEQVKIVIDSSSPVNHTLALRLPDWCDKPQVTLNGAPVTQDVRKGYLHISHLWQEGDTLQLTLPMPVRRIYGAGAPPGRPGRRPARSAGLLPGAGG